jgi:amidohydrolase
MTTIVDVEGLRDKLVAWRRDFHMHPELSYKEERSAAIIAEQLRRLGYDVRTKVARTGVIGSLQCNQPGPVVAFRFDMDALPVTEETGAAYASTVDGQMHACGHDGHMAMGMGLAEMLAARRGDLRGGVKFLFQPAEEGGNGAEEMVKAGALEDPRPDVFVASHVWIERPVGSADVSSGPVLAAADKWDCTIRGRGGHGAMPHHTADPIVAAAQAISALQAVVSRNVPPLRTAVVSVGAVHGGDAFNVIPEEVRMTGTIRTYDPTTREMVVQRVREVFEGVAAACGSEAELSVRSLTPAVINDGAVAEVVRKAAQEILGEENVTSRERTTGSEDAAFFMQKVPGCYFFLGAANPQRGKVFPHHSSRFDFDEEALVYGVAILKRVAKHYLL